jgi:hypothetical protein
MLTDLLQYAAENFFILEKVLIAVCGISIFYTVLRFFLGRRDTI